MEEVANELLLASEREVAALHVKKNDIAYYQACISIYIRALEQLKTYFLQHSFKDKKEEINFFKVVKPKFVCKLIYFNELYSIEVAKPSSSKKSLRNYYKLHLQKFDTFFNDNMQIYKYLRSGDIVLDRIYFCRGKPDLKMTLDSSYFLTDNRFNTAHDYTVAKFYAIEMLQQFIQTQLRLLVLNKEEAYELPVLRWTGQKVALVELIYALYDAKVFENGNCDLKEIADLFAKVFDIDLGQYHRIFIEIRSRKSDSARFLQSLEQNLLKRIDHADK